MGCQEKRADEMAINNYSIVPQWVRSTICVVGCFSVPGLILASYLGAQVNPYLTLVVGFFAMRTSSFAFDGKMVYPVNAWMELLPRLLKRPRS